MHTGGVTKPLPTVSPADDQDAVTAELVSVLDSAHLVWSNPEERRRMRFFGFRPAVEPGVLKREWHGMKVRVSSTLLRAAWPDVGVLESRSPERVLLMDGAPFTPSAPAMQVAQQVLDLIQSYERWVEAREGKDRRIGRGQIDGRAVNPLAETRRLQRAMQVRRRRSR